MYIINVLKSILFGIIEGITEWLPVSSTGHMILLEKICQFKEVKPEFFEMFLVVIQLGAIMAVIVMFWNKLWPFRSVPVSDTKKALRIRPASINLWLKVLVGSIPAGVLGLLFDDLLDKYLYGVAVFIVAQLCYAVYLTYISGKKLPAEILKRIVPAIVASGITAALGFKGNIILPAAYAVCIGINIAHSVELYIQKPTKNHRMLMIGFIVFVIGDICVGLRHMPFIAENIASVLYFITWISYPPSQILVLTSAEN